MTTPTPAPAPMTVEDQQAIERLHEWVNWSGPRAAIADKTIERAYAALTARVAELERQVVDWTVRTGRQVERADAAEAKLESAIRGIETRIIAHGAMDSRHEAHNDAIKEALRTLRALQTKDTTK